MSELCENALRAGLRRAPRGLYECHGDLRWSDGSDGAVLCSDCKPITRNEWMKRCRAAMQFEVDEAKAKYELMLDAMNRCRNPSWWELVIPIDLPQR